MIVDNIVIGNIVEGLTEEKLGLLPDEITIRFTVEEVTNDKGEIFLPAILKMAGLFDSTSQIRSINTQRQKAPKFKADADQNLWRNLDQPEMTSFKVGKKVFWLIVGVI